MKNAIKILVLCAALWSISAIAQTGSDTAPPATDVKAATPDKDTPPQKGDFFGQAFAGHWTFTSEINLGQEYDDNVFSSDLFRLSDNVSRYSGRFSAAVQKKRWRIQVHYLPEYVSYLKYSQRNALSHQYSHEIEYKISGHTDFNWTVFASRAPGYTNSPFQLLDFFGIVFPVFHPEALQSDATIFSANTDISLSHQFTARNTLTVDVKGQGVKFTEDNGVPLSTLTSQNSFSGGVTVRWDDEFVPKQKLGLEVTDSYFGFLDPGSHTHYQFVKLRYSRSFGHGYDFTVAAGPGRTERQADQLMSTTTPNKIDYSADASFTKVGPRQNLGVTYSHGTSLGLTQGSVASDTVSATFSRKIGRKWQTDASVGYSRSLTETPILLSTTNGYSANGNIGYSLTPNLLINTGYSYINQGVTQNLPGGLKFDGNVYRVNIKYTFERITSR